MQDRIELWFGDSGVCCDERGNVFSICKESIQTPTAAQVQIANIFYDILNKCGFSIEVREDKDIATGDYTIHYRITEPSRDFGWPNSYQFTYYVDEITARRMHRANRMGNWW